VFDQVGAVGDSHVPTLSAAGWWHRWLSDRWPSNRSFDRDFEADAFQAAKKLARRLFGVQPVEVVPAVFLVFRAVADHRPRDDQNPVRDCDGGLPQTMLVRDPFE
jgi:hypothetical protein